MLELFHSRLLVGGLSTRHTRTLALIANEKAEFRLKSDIIFWTKILPSRGRGWLLYRYARSELPGCFYLYGLEMKGIRYSLPFECDYGQNKDVCSPHILFSGVIETVNFRQLCLGYLGSMGHMQHHLWTWHSTAHQGKVS